MPEQAATYDAEAPDAAPALPKLTRLADNPTVRAAFAEALAESECATPWRVDPTDPGCILNAAGEEVARVDALPRATCQRVATLICQAVNVFAGREPEVV